MGKLSQDVIDHWPDVFGDIDVQALPIEYIRGINVEFEDGKVWQIDIDPRSDFEIRAVEEHMEELMSEYEDVITKIDFNLNVEKVKKDIQKRTNRFMKKRT